MGLERIENRFQAQEKANGFFLCLDGNEEDGHASLCYKPQPWF
jgi:hypothetical protein